MPYEDDLVSEPTITLEEAKTYVTREIRAQGLVPTEPELDNRFWFVRILSPKGQAIGIVTISPYVVDEPKPVAEASLREQILEGIRAALKEPIMRVA